MIRSPDLRPHAGAPGRPLGRTLAVVAVLGLGSVAGCRGVDTAPMVAEAASTGRLVLVGGALDPDNGAIYEAILEGRAGPDPICVLPTASGVPAESMVSAVERLDRWGGPGTAVGVLLTEDAPQRADDPEVASRLRGCGGYFFTGGSQSRIVSTFRPDGRSTAAYDAVVARWREGAVVAGTSAGAAMMGGRIIAGGSSGDAFEHGVGSDGGEDGVAVEEGMDLFDGAWIDQHFLARGRWGRLLLTVVREGPYDLGIGIDENTALVVDGSTARVVGASGVVVLDAGAATVGEGRVEGVRAWLLGAGDALELEARTVTVGADKRPVAEHPAPAFGAAAPAEGEGTDPVGEGPFDRWRLLMDLDAVGRDPAPLAYGVEGGWTVTWTPSTGFRGLAVAGAGPRGTHRGLHVGPFEVTLAGPEAGDQGPASRDR